MSYASGLRSLTTGAPWVREHVGSQEAQVEGRNALRAVRRWSFGLAGRPKFRRYARRMRRSLECKDLNGNIRPVIENGHLVGVVYRGRRIRLFASRAGAAGGRHCRDKQDELSRVETAIQEKKLRYCRIVSVFVRGRWCHEAQFVLDGAAPLRHPVGTESMATVDLGPQWLHVVHDSGSRHIPIAPSVESIARELRRLQRKLDRQHRAGSPRCFDDKGRHVNGRCYWKERSKAALQTQQLIAECHRVMAARRDADHGRTANAILAISANVRSEDHGTKSWQLGLLCPPGQPPPLRLEDHGTKSWQLGHWSKSVQRRGPGAQMARIERATARAGGTYTPLDSRLALSQTCIGGERAKKALSQRRHVCEDHGLDLDRDLFSSFLMRHVVIEPDGTQHLNLDAASAELFGSALDSMKREQEGVPAPAPLKRQDLGVGPEETLSGQEKQRVLHRRPPGRRSQVRIRKRFEAKAKKRSDRAARLEGGVAAAKSVANQSSPTAKAA
jgi:putative transposase